MTSPGARSRLSSRPLGTSFRRRRPSRSPRAGERASHSGRARRVRSFRVLWNEWRARSVPAVMTTIGFIGSGHIGSTVARLAVDAGHDVVLSNSRGPETLQGLADELGPHARPGTTEEAAQAGDLVVLTIPLVAVDSVPAALLAGKVVIDTSNYYPQRDGQIAALDDRSTTTSGLVQSLLPGSTVVKGF